MKLVLKRLAKKSNYTVGKLYINDQYFCDTLEDTDRGLTQDIPLQEISKLKIKHNTAIPTGTYKITLDIISPRFSTKQVYKKIDGKLPRLTNVPGFDGILIHIGNTDKDSSGCILVGQNKVVGKVINSTDTFFKLYDKLLEDKNNITIIIQ